MEINKNSLALVGISLAAITYGICFAEYVKGNLLQRSELSLVQSYGNGEVSRNMAEEIAKGNDPRIGSFSFTENPISYLDELLTREGRRIGAEVYLHHLDTAPNRKALVEFLSRLSL